MSVRTLCRKQRYGRDDERDLAFAGFLTFFDRPKQGASQAIADLAKLGPRCHSPRDRSRAHHVRQHPQVRVDHDQRESRQHGEHGGRIIPDIPAIGLADDTVDPELVERPERWNIGAIARFMATFGVLSSVFDLLTFGTLLAVFPAAPALFRTGWFVESLLTELVIALVVRTRRPFARSRPGTLLLTSTVALIALTLAIPYVPSAGIFGFVPLPGSMMLTICGITVLYVFAAEQTKRWFYAPSASPRSCLLRLRATGRGPSTT